jgi:hypothetical protein
MAKKKHNEVAVGLTTLVVLGLTVYIVVALADWSSWFIKHQSINVRVPYQTGLKGLAQGSPIILGGTKIGQITRTWIGPPETTPDGRQEIYIYFTMQIPAHYILKKDCVLSPYSNMLGGQATLVIKNVGVKGEDITSGQTVDVMLEGGIADTIEAMKQELNSSNPDSLLYQIKYQMNRQNADSIMASMITTMNNLVQISEKINLQITDDPQKQTLMAKLQGILGKIREITDQLNGQLAADKDGTTMAKIHHSLDTLNSALTQVDDLIKINKTPVTEAISKINTTIDDVRSAAANLKEFTGTARELLTANRDGVESIIRNVDEVSVNLKMASREIRRAPWKLIYKPTKNELQVQSVVDAAGSFAAGAERLDDVSLRLKALMQAAENRAPVDKERINNIIADLETTFEQFQKAEKKLWDELK